MKKTMILTLVLVFALSVGFLESSMAQKYPAKAVKIVTTHGPGSGVDICTRILAPYLQKELGQPVVIENMQGGGGRIARTKVFKEKPDGYTLLSTNFPSAQLGEVLYKGDYKSSEFTQIYGFLGGDNYYIAFVDKKSKFKDYKSLLEASKTKKIKVAIPGMGAGAHLIAAVLRTKTGLVADIIPYDPEQIILAVLSGDVDMACENGYDYAAENGQRIQVILQASDGKRSVVYPDVPTTAELGFPGLELASTTNIVGPPGVPADVVKILVDALNKATNNPEFLAAYKKAGLVAAHQGPQEVKMFNDTMMRFSNEIAPIMKKDMETLGSKK